MSFKNSLRDRAIAAWFKTNPDFKNRKVVAVKRRSCKHIIVMQLNGGFPVTWSYKNGGKLEKVA